LFFAEGRGGRGGLAVGRVLGRVVTVAVISGFLAFHSDEWQGGKCGKCGQLMRLQEIRFISLEFRLVFCCFGQAEILCAGFPFSEADGAAGQRSADYASAGRC